MSEANTTDDQTSTTKLVRDSEPRVGKKPQFEIGLRVEKCYLTR